MVALAVAGALLVVACGGSADASDTIEGQDVEVQMYDNRFQYSEIRIPVGGSVNWVGAGANAHNAVEANDLWSTEEVFGSLDQYEDDAAKLTYDEQGQYVFYCTYHGNAEGDGMAGVLIVGDEG